MKISQLLNPFRTLSNALVIPAERSYYSIQANLTIMQLDHAKKEIVPYLDQEASIERLQPLIDFLNSRWALIRGTSLCYTSAPNDDINKLCICLAECIEPIVKKGVRQLLMPSIQVPVCDVTSTSIEDPALFLHHMVLNDDETRFIQVAECLEFAESDGELKHTSLFGPQHNKVQKLSNTEMVRVAGHSHQAEDYYDAMQSVVSVKQHGINIGAFIQRLINQLSKGGAHAGRGGEEHLAAENANVGIIAFQDFLSKLTPSEKHNLFERKCPGITDNFGILWQRLSNPVMPVAGDEMTVLQCVELVAHSMERILEENPDLFTIHPSNTKDLDSSFKAVMQDFSETKKNFQTAIARPDYVIEDIYGEAGHIRFLNRLFSDATWLGLTIEEKDELLAQLPILTMHDLCEMLDVLSYDNACQFITKLPERLLFNLYRSLDDTLDAMIPLTPKNRWVLIHSIPHLLDRAIHSQKDFAKLLTALPFYYWQTFIHQLGPQKLERYIPDMSQGSLINRVKDFNQRLRQYIVTHLPAEASEVWAPWIASKNSMVPWLLVAQLTKADLFHLVQSPSHLTTLLATMPIILRGTIIDLWKGKLPQLLQVGAELVDVLSTLSPNQVSEVISSLDVDYLKNSLTIVEATSLLKLLPPSGRIKFANTLGAEFWQAHLQNTNELKDILSALATDALKFLNLIGGKSLRELMTSIYAGAVILNVLAEKNWPVIIGALKDDKILDGPIALAELVTRMSTSDGRKNCFAYVVTQPWFGDLMIGDKKFAESIKNLDICKVAYGPAIYSALLQQIMLVHFDRAQKELEARGSACCVLFPSKSNARAKWLNAMTALDSATQLKDVPSVTRLQKALEKLNDKDKADFTFVATRCLDNVPAFHQVFSTHAHRASGRTAW